LAKEYAGEQETLNFRTALLCSIIAEVNRDRKKRNRPYTPEDFMPKKKIKKVELTNEQMRQQLEMLNVALGGEVK